MKRYEIVIGLEVHVQLLTESKVFCGCSTKFGLPPNSSTCPVCLGLPGTLPVLNEKAFFYAIKTALALDCEIQNLVKFDRKNYFYPDLPKNFQISQYDKPLAYNGSLDIKTESGEKKIKITRIHLEEDAGKLIHSVRSGVSYLDLNRAGSALMEIVSEPDMRSPEEADIYLQNLKAVLLCLEVSDCNMEEGSLRCDANISVRPEGESRLGQKVELKNMNSFKAVREALRFEAARQIEAAEEGEKILQETRLWNRERGVTVTMRTKEETHDYRYFPEPDLIPFVVDNNKIESIRQTVPELPQAKAMRFSSQYSLSGYDAHVLTRDAWMANFFEETVKKVKKPKEAANWLLGDILRMLNDRKTLLANTRFKPEHLAEIIGLVESHEITAKTAKDILPKIFDTGASPGELIKSGGLGQMKDRVKLTKVIDEVLKENMKSAEDYKKGKTAAIMFLIGRVMRKTGGKANPQELNEILTKRLNDEE